MSKSIDIKTKHAGVIEFQIVDGGERGILQVAEAQKNIPFPIKRTMVISRVKEGESRGAHGHRKIDQVIVPLVGSFTLGIDDGETKQEIFLDNPAFGIRLMPKLWHTMTNFSSDAVVLVFCDGHHDEADYIRDYSQFLEFVRNNP